MYSIVNSIYHRIRNRLSPHKKIIQSVKPFTMLSEDRLNKLLKVAVELNGAKIPGDFVECGTCRGGSGALLAWAAHNCEPRREVYLFDSFQGHPSATSEDAPDREEVKKWAGTMVASQEDVRLVLRSVSITDLTKIHIVPGWFRDSIPPQNILQIALVHLDADWYDSTMYCLNTLYARVVPGGYLVVDDYHGFEGCKQAVDTFFSTRWDEVKKNTVGVALVLHKRT